MHSSQDTKNAYDEIYAGPGILLRDSLYLWLISLLEPQPGRSLLDISCGEGRLVKLAMDQRLAAVGIDFSRHGVRKGVQLTGRGNFAVGDGEKMPVGTSVFDYVTHIGSLEHYQNPEAGASEIARTLKPGGRAVVMLPNTFGILHIGHVMKTGDVHDDGQPLQRYASRGAWERVLVAGGLRVLHVTGHCGYTWPRNWRDTAWLLRRPNKLARMALGLLTPANLANHVVYVCTK